MNDMTLFNICARLGAKLPPTFIGMLEVRPLPCIVLTTVTVVRVGTSYRKEFKGRLDPETIDSEVNDLIGAAIDHALSYHLDEKNRIEDGDDLPF